MRTIISIMFILSAHVVFAQKIIREAVYSNKMDKNVDVVVILPNIDKGVEYKTVYILHGYSGNPERTYQKDIPDLIAKARDYKTIYVIPDGNYCSWYVDSPVNEKSQYQTFVGKELVSYIDNKYPTIKNKEARGILGWSMGGYGALHIGITNNNIFSIIGSSCGALDLNQLGPYYEQFQVDKVLGSFEKLNMNYLIFQKEDVMVNTGQKLILDCGTEDMLIDMNRDYHEYLIKNRIDHQYIEYLGKHDTDYWSKALSVQLMLFENYLKK